MTDDIHKKRLGKFTASEIYKLMGERGGINTDGAQTYIREKVAEELSGWYEDVSSKEMDWGIQLEPDARAYYEIAFNIEVIPGEPVQASFCEDASCTPDGIILGQRKGIEIKCPYNPANHISHLVINNANDLKIANKKYYWQVQMCMLVLGFDVWDFISYDPRYTGRYRMAVVEIAACKEDHAKLIDNILQASKQKQDMILNINGL